MELWLVLRGVAGDEREIAVEAQHTHTVDDLLRAAGVTADCCRLVRTGVLLRPGMPLSATGLRSGDTIDTGSQAPELPTPGWRLVVGGGPATGRVVPLATTTVVGRSRAADVTLEDPSLSRRHLQLTVESDAVVVSDAQSSNGTFLDGERLTQPQVLQPGSLVEAGDTVLRVERAAPRPRPGTTSDGRLAFSRPPRMQPPTGPVVHDLPGPPGPLTRRHLPLASSLVPLAAAPVLAAATGNSSFLAFAALAPVMALASYGEDAWSGSRTRRKELAAFQAEVSRVAGELAEGVRREGTSRWAACPDPVEVLQRALGPAPRLWERRPADADFLRLRAGWADQPATTTWRMREGGDQEVREAARQLLDGHGVVRNAPVVLDLHTTKIAGIVGPPDATAALTRWLVAQAAVLHSPRDLSIAVAVPTAEAPAWGWTAWLPHAMSAGGGPAFAVGDDAARALLSDLTDLVRARTDAAKDGSAAEPAVLLVLDERLRVPRPVVAALLEAGPAVGLHVLWTAARADDLPGETGTIVETTSSTVTTILVASGERIVDGQPDRCRLAMATELARSLAGIRDATARSHTGTSLPTSVALPELLGEGRLDTAAVEQRWTGWNGSLEAPIGRSGAGLFSLDLRRDGPHALLGGTTGAGKSELLQTFVVSLAASIPPTRLTFLLVDYKGGAAFKDCVRLPHVVGCVTDLDGHLVSRALTSLNAELSRRERMLAAAGAKDLLEMERKAPGEAPPSLLVVVDEFATLAKELPEFVDGVVDVAQRGRSLGIHMLLATQRPAGAINDNIRANTNLRVALRMNDEADSQDVIGLRSAAALPRSLPGRAFVRTGAAEVTEVQVAYAGGHSLDGPVEVPLLVHPLRWGRTLRADAAGTVPHPQVHDAHRPTDLQRVVELVGETRDRLDLPAQHAPWLPPLPDLLPLDALPLIAGLDGAAVGLIDLPARQAQQAFVLAPFEQGSLLVVGASGAGKTTLLRSLAVQLARRRSPKQLHVYGLDFGAGGLGALRALPHCGAVIDGTEVERAQRLFGLLDRWVAERRQRFGEVGCGSLEEYDRLAGDAHPLPRVFVLLDGYGGFRTVFDKIDFGARVDALPQLVQDARPLGISFVVTADRPSAVPLALLAALPARTALHLADPDEAASLGLDSRVVRAAQLSPGRGFTTGTLEVQVAVVGADPAGDAQSRAVEAAGHAMRERWGDGTAAAVGELPRDIALGPLLPHAAPLCPVLGLGEPDLAPAIVDLAEGNVLVAGPHRSGRSTALAALAAGLRHADPGLQLHLLAPRRTPLLGLDVWTSTVRGETAIEQLLQALLDALPGRDPDDPPVVLVLDDGHELVDTASDALLSALARRGRDGAVHLLGASETGAAHRSYGGWITEVRKERHGVLLQPDSDLDGDLLGARLARTRPGGAGRGVLVTRAGAAVVQVAR